MPNVLIIVVLIVAGFGFAWLMADICARRFTTHYHLPEDPASVLQDSSDDDQDRNRRAS